jgi:hypothetical protein
MSAIFKFTKYDKQLILLFALTLPLSNPWVRGDGVGYYAFARSTLIEHRLDFAKDWAAANESFRLGRIDAHGQIVPEEYTSTGHLNNHFAVGPALLWAPFLVSADVGIIAFDKLGGRIARDGFSRPYLTAMAFGTAVYGFLAVFLSFRLARNYVREEWAFLAALGIWFGSSLPVYMYFNPSWSHAHSAFTVALFVWYWARTRTGRTRTQYLILGAIAGLMVDVYYLNAIVLVLPLLEVATNYWKRRGPERIAAPPLLAGTLWMLIAAFLAFLPTLVTKKILYGSIYNFGYTERWYWLSPALVKVGFSSEHGLFTWTPVVLLAVVGLIPLCKHDREFALYALAVVAIYWYAVGCYQDWSGLSSFGARFFVSLTVLFVTGLAVLFEALASAWRHRAASIFATTATAVLVLWNLGLIFQWGIHLIPARGPISWRIAAHNQVAVVPVIAASTVRAYLTQRSKLMDEIEQQDVRQIKSVSSAGAE